MQNIKKVILNILLGVIFQRKVYHYPFVQSCLKLQLVIMVKDKFVMVKDGDRTKIPSVEVNLAQKHSLMLTIKDYLAENISKKVSNSTFLDVYLVDFCREMVEREDESKLFVDDLYLKLDLTNCLCKCDLLENAELVTLDDVKLMQFKNKFHIFDYKVLLKAQKEEGVSVK